MKLGLGLIALTLLNMFNVFLTWAGIIPPFVGMLLAIALPTFVARLTMYHVNLKRDEEVATSGRIENVA